GLSIDVAGYLVEVLSGEPLDKYMKENVFDPLKMDDTGFFVPEEKHDRLCGLYSKGKDGQLEMASGQFNEGFKKPAILFSGGGGLVSTIDDYAQFCRMLLNDGELDGAQILKPETAKMIMSNQLPETAKYNRGKAGYGLAGAVQFDSGEYSWAGMASTNFWINPQEQMIIITCTQLLPSNYSYGNQFKKKIEAAIMD
ncbi:MAG: serine hydrolase, partial [Draconibacterium sp.]|nr:serine hydrolase [Draconibacterium sp.]